MSDNARPETQETQSPSSSRETGPAERLETDNPKGSEDRIGGVVSESKSAVAKFGKDMAGELKKPTTGAAVAGAVVAGAAMTVGAAETALGAATAYVTYRILKRKHAKERK